MAIKINNDIVIDNGKNVNAGIVTATDGFNLGISSAGTSITSGPVKTLNFVGTGNTFAVSGTSVNISIASGAQATMVVPTRSGTAVTFTLPTTNILGVVARSGTINIPV